MTMPGRALNPVHSRPHRPGRPPPRRRGAVPHIDRTPGGALMDRERETFRTRHRRSAELAADAKGSLLFGVPMNWMTRWPGDHPVFVDRADGAQFWDVDGNVF